MGAVIDIVEVIELDIAVVIFSLVIGSLEIVIVSEILESFLY